MLWVAKRTVWAAINMGEQSAGRESVIRREAMPGIQGQQSLEQDGRGNNIIHISWAGGMGSASARLYGASTTRRSRRRDASTGGMEPDVGAQDSRTASITQGACKAKIKHCKSKSKACKAQTRSVWV
jgi:hypothetical protein